MLYRNQVQGATENLPVGKEQAQGVVGGLQKTAGGLAGTVGGGVKGIVDTAGNTVSLSFKSQSRQPHEDVVSPA